MVTSKSFESSIDDSRIGSRVRWSKEALAAEKRRDAGICSSHADEIARLTGRENEGDADFQMVAFPRYLMTREARRQAVGVNRLCRNNGARNDVRMRTTIT